jgi:hypothetical protein
MAMDRGRHARIDFVDQRIELTGGPVAIPSHVDAGAEAAGGRRQRHVFLADDALPVLPPFVHELGAAFLLNVVVRRRGLSFCRH